MTTSPNGTLIAMGGAEQRLRGNASFTPEELDHFRHRSILHRLVQAAGGPEARIEVVTTASIVPEQRGRDYQRSFEVLGCRHIGLLDLRHRRQITATHLDRIRNCQALLFSGGTQRRLATVFSSTSILQQIRERYREEGLVVAGTSAGAMALGPVMIYKGTAMTTHLKGTVKTLPGFDLAQEMIIDSHFERSGRFARLSQMVATYPHYLGLGLGEDSAVILSRGELEAIGSGWVTMIDGREIKYNNLPQTAPGQPASIEGLRVHLCASGTRFIPGTGALTHPA